MPTPFRDTSKGESPRTPRTPSQRTPSRVFFAFVGSKVKAPTGYAFNGRGDLVKLTREAARRAA